MKKNREMFIKRKRERKQRAAMFFIIMVLMALFMRVLYIYVAHGDEYRRSSIRQQALENAVDQFITPNRGGITDRNSQHLAIGYSVYNVIIDVRLMHSSIEGNRAHDRTRALNAIKALYEYLDIEEGRIEYYLSINPETGSLNRDTHHLILVRAINPVSALSLSPHFPFIVLEEDTAREYPRGYLASNIIGFLSGDGNHWGLEGYYDIELSGNPGRRIRQFTERGVVQTNEFMPENGHTLVTTLDARLQERLLNIITSYSITYEVQRGMILVMNPNTGEVVSMVQYPSFDNSVPSYIGYVTSPRARDRLREMEGADRTAEFFRIWSNSNIGYSFEPGSIFKPMVAAKALELGVIHRNETFHCPGFIYIAGVRINCWIFRHTGAGHGTLSLSDSMAVSCNVSIILIATRLGRTNMYNLLRDFGVGQFTGIDIVGELNTWHLGHTYSNFNAVEIATAGMGQGFNMTPIQALNAFNAVINGGNLMKPFVVSRVVDINGNIVSENIPTVTRNLLSKQTSEFWRTEMERTMTMPGATGLAARMDGIPSGGKTGTGEQVPRGSQRYSNAFKTFLPVENPEYSVMVILYISEPNGIPSALPAGTIGRLAREVMEEVVVIREVDFGRGQISGATAILEDYTGLSTATAFTKLRDKGLLVDFLGNGTTVMSQQPEPFTELTLGTRVILFLGDAYDEYLTQNATVPNLVGLDIETATYILLELGLYYNIRHEAELEEPKGIIISQMPIENTRIGMGTSVTLIIE